MIGQNSLKDIFSLMIENSTFPRFCILTGAVGSGKKTMCDWIVGKFRDVNPVFTSYKLPDTKVDSIRDMITVSYQAVNPIIYILADADNMSVAAKNSLLKVTEEPPNNAYFIMTLESADYTLDTIKSRASIYSMGNYSSDEICEYAKRKYNSTQDELQIIKNVSDTPGQVDSLYVYNPHEFYDYVVKVVDNIAKAEDANVFKVADKLAIKADSEGYDVKLFLRAFMSVCVERMSEEPLKYATGTSLTGKYISQLGIRGISKAMLIDAWLMEIRRYWVR